jgi:hypothetical protein
VPATDLLLREQRITTPWLAVTAEIVFGLLAVLWMTLIVAGFAALDRDRHADLGGRSRSTRRPAARTQVAAAAR